MWKRAGEDRKRKERGRAFFLTMMHLLVAQSFIGVKHHGQVFISRRGVN